MSKNWGLLYLNISFKNGNNLEWETGASEKEGGLTVVANKIYNINLTGAFKGLLPGKFSVSANAQVQFTTGNLCYNTTTQKSYLAPYQTYYNTNVTGNERCYFAWNENISGASTYDVSETGDIFAKTMTLDGITSTLTILSKTEWEYLLGLGTGSQRAYASNLCKSNVMVGTVHCLVIAPDGFTGTLKTSYSMEEVKSSGLVFLPYAGHVTATSPYKHVPTTQTSGFMGMYWSSNADGTQYAYNLSLNSGGTSSASVTTERVGKAVGRSIRLVKKVTTSSN